MLLGGNLPEAPLGLPVLQGPPVEPSTVWLVKLLSDVQLADPVRTATWVSVVQGSAPADRDVSPIAMGMLEGLGRTLAQLLRVLSVDRGNVEATLIERQAALRSSALDQALARLLRINVPGPARAAPPQLYRVLGVLSCWRLDDHVLRLLEDARADRRLTMSPQAKIQSRFDHLQPDFVLLQGPPRRSDYVVEVRTTDGQMARGTASTISEAQDAAASVWLEQQATRTGRHVISRPEAEAIRVSAERLELSADGQSALASAVRLGEPQQDSALSRLMHLGRAYADHLIARERALDVLWQTLDPRPSMAKPLRLDDETLAAAIGEVAEGTIPIAIAAIGVAAREQGPGARPGDPVQSPFEGWVAARTREAREKRQSAADELSAFVLAAGASISWSDVRQDDGGYRSQSRVESFASKAASKLVAKTTQPTVSEARNSTAEIFLRLAQASCRPESLPPRTPLEKQVFGFWLRHLFAAMPTTTRERHRWRQLGLAAVDLTAQPDELASWIRKVDEFLGDTLVAAKLPAVAAYFHEASSGRERQHRPAFTAEMELVLDWVERKANDGDYAFKGTDEWDVLTSLLIVERVASAGGAVRALTTEVENWLDLQKDTMPRPPLTFEARQVKVSDLSAQALFGLLDVAAIGARKVQCERPVMSVRAVGGDGVVSLRVDGARRETWSRLVDDDPVVACLNELGTALRVDVRPGEVHIRVDAADKASGSLAKAVLAPRRNLEAELTGRLLHDLKNLLVASELASVSAQSADRTTGLQTALAAQQHLDEARLVVARLRESAGMVGGSTEPVDAVAFVRAYAADVLPSLPATIGLTLTGSMSGAVVVDTSPAILRACLANLVRNACEAMPDGGALTLGTQSGSSPDVIRLQIADTGPGVPPNVLSALYADRTVNSTKSGGSGLGLVSVRQSLLRVGGVLTPEPRDDGHTWWIELPTTESELAHD